MRSATQEEWDLFISYAHNDDHNGHITQLKKTIETKYRTFFGDRDIKIFLSTTSITSGEVWRDVIHKALRESKVMLVLLSENYLNSKWCRKEFTTWGDLERERGCFRGLLLPAFYIDVKQCDNWNAQVEEELKRLECDDEDGPEYGEAPGSLLRADECLASLKINQAIDLKPWYEEGETALKLAGMQERLRDLTEKIHSSLTLADRAAKSPSNLPRYNGRFVGRNPELVEIRDTFQQKGLSKLVVLHGVSGDGKTSLALTYAQVFAHEYLGGRWLIDCAGVDDLVSAFIKLRDDLKHKFVFDEKYNENSQFCQILGWLRNQPSLVILDNIDRSEFLSQQAVSRLGNNDSSLHILATTRDDSQLLSKDYTQAIEVRGLSLCDGQKLLHSFHPIQEEDKEAARGIVDIVGGHAYSLELAGAYLRDKPNYGYAKLEENLKKMFVDTMDELHSRASTQCNYARALSSKQFVEFFQTPVLDNESSPLEKRALLLAALLAPNGVIGPWVKAALAVDFPEVNNKDKPSNPWEKANERFLGLCLWHQDMGSATNIFNMRRLTREVVLARALAEPDGQNLVTNLVKRLHDLGCKAAQELYQADKPWMFSHIHAMLPTASLWLNNDSWVPHTLNLPGCLTNILADAGQIEESKKLIEKVLPLLPPSSADDEAADITAFYLVCYGHILKARGDLSDALTRFEEARAIRAGLAGNSPKNVDRQWNLAVSLRNLGGLLEAQGDSNGALTRFEKARAIMIKLSENDPQNADWQRELSFLLNNVAHILQKRGDSSGALARFEEALAINDRLAKSDPQNTIWQMDLSVSLNNVAHILQKRGDSSGALACFEEALAINDRLAKSDPQNTIWQKKLLVSVTNRGDIFEERGDSSTALARFEEALTINAGLVERDPQNVGWQRDRAGLLSRVGDILKERGDSSTALARFEEALTINAGLVERDPQNVDWQRAKAGLLGKVGYILKEQRGDLSGALARFEEARDIRARLVERDSQNVDFKRGLAISLVDLGLLLFRGRGGVRGASDCFKEACDICARLMESDPQNTDSQRELGRCLTSMSHIFTVQKDFSTALTYLEEARAIAAKLGQNDPKNADWQINLAVSLLNLGNIFQEWGNLTNALTHFEEARAITAKLVRSDPQNSRCQSLLLKLLRKSGYILVEQGDLNGAVVRFGEIQAILARSSANRSKTKKEFSRALVSFEEERVIMTKLVQIDPQNTDWQSDLAISLNNVGEILQKLGDVSGALTRFEEARAIMTNLTQIAPQNTGWQNDLADSLVNMSHSLHARGPKKSIDGYLLKAREDFLSDSLAGYQDACSSMSRVAEIDPPRAAVWQRDLAISLGNMRRIFYVRKRKLVDIRSKFGRIFHTQGLKGSMGDDIFEIRENVSATLTCLEEARSIMTRLAQSDPKNAVWPKKLADVEWKIMELKK